ncbi:hypothetical protein FGG30_gp079 [Mycobacterium phage Pixie]|uniref:Uncharacterized protein n=2 Tax=Keshuvirus pixie TaxID=1034114 RepID=G1D4Y8_9CAUD|nr:hypothetical protein FGG30_gp079 [Mycobacterium phage Pixie]AEK09889.1 hypothetical protein PBI_PIXIE_79 [Mycobacterium phage Pixie]AOT23815.1 hypothetical protein SEA_TBOND007_76 [Mycobacterium phage TBond007]
MIDLNNLPHGLRLSVYRSSLGDCTNGGVSAAADHLTLVGWVKPGEKHVRALWPESQVFPVREDAPAVVMVESNLHGALPHLVPLDAFLAGKWTMHGGNLAGGDSRFGGLIERGYRGPKCVATLPVHDRIES